MHVLSRGGAFCCAVISVVAATASTVTAAANAFAAATTPTPTCLDSHAGALDACGSPCSDHYAASVCGHYDDGDFTALEMCCACGGGERHELVDGLAETETELEHAGRLLFAFGWSPSPIAGGWSPSPVAGGWLPPTWPTAPAPAPAPPVVMIAYKRGPNASNSDRSTCSSPGTLEQAQAMCNADPLCRSLHDFDCDGENWRHCSAAVGDFATGDGGACTMERVRVIYESGAMVDNDAFVNHNCTAPIGTREQAQAMCNADPLCISLHDWNCDEVNWRYCSSAVGEAAVGYGDACTMERVEVAPAVPELPGLV